MFSSVGQERLSTSSKVKDYQVFQWMGMTLMTLSFWTTWFRLPLSTWKPQSGLGGTHGLWHRLTTQLNETAGRKWDSSQQVVGSVSGPPVNCQTMTESQLRKTSATSNAVGQERLCTIPKLKDSDMFRWMGLTLMILSFWTTRFRLLLPTKRPQKGSDRILTPTSPYSLAQQTVQGGSETKISI